MSCSGFVSSCCLQEFRSRFPVGWNEWHGANQLASACLDFTEGEIYCSALHYLNYPQMILNGSIQDEPCQYHPVSAFTFLHGNCQHNTNERSRWAYWTWHDLYFSSSFELFWAPSRTLALKNWSEITGPKMSQQITTAGDPKQSGGVEINVGDTSSSSYGKP